MTLPEQLTNIAEQTANVIGAFYVLLTTILVLMPKQWRATQLLARIAGDLKKVLHDDEDVARKIAEEKEKQTDAEAE